MSTNNISTKDMKTTIEMIEKSMEMKQKHGINLVPRLLGNHGIGKSAIMYQLAKKYDYEVSVINLASMDIGDMMGNPDHVNGGYKRPDWLIESDKPVLFFLDELSRGPKYILQSIFSLVNEGRFGNWKIKPNDFIVVADNPSDKYEVSSFEDSAFISRFMHIKVQPEQKEYVSYLNSKVKNTIVQETLKKTVNIYQSEEFDIGFNVTPDNRSLEKVAMMLDVMDDSEIENVGVFMFESLLGFESSSAIMEQWRESKKNEYDPKDILNAEEYEFNEDDIEILNTINLKMLAYIKKKKLTKKEKEGFSRYVQYQPIDLALAFARDVVHVKEELIDVLPIDFITKLAKK